MGERKRRKWDVPAAAAEKPPETEEDAKKVAKQAAERINVILAEQGLGTEDAFSDDVTINDSPARYFLTRTTTHQQIYRETKAGIRVRGQYLPPGVKTSAVGDPPLYLHVTGGTPEIVQAAIDKIKWYMKQAEEDAKTGKFVYSDSVVNDKVMINLDQSKISPSVFNVARQVLGPRGQYVKYIESETGAKCQLRGAGSGFKEGPDEKESEDPMHLYLQAPNEKILEKAKGLATSLIGRVKAEYERALNPAAAAPAAAQPAAASVPTAVAPSYTTPVQPYAAQYQQYQQYYSQYYQQAAPAIQPPGMTSAVAAYPQASMPVTAASGPHMYSQAAMSTPYAQYGGYPYYAANPYAAAATQAFNVTAATAASSTTTPQPAQAQHRTFQENPVGPKLPTVDEYKQASASLPEASPTHAHQEASTRGVKRPISATGSILNIFSVGRCSDSFKDPRMLVMDTLVLLWCRCLCCLLTSCQFSSHYTSASEFMFSSSFCLLV